MDNNNFDQSDLVVERPKPKRTSKPVMVPCPVQNEDQAKYGREHEELILEDFLRTKANVIPNTSILTWRWRGNDLYAQIEAQTDMVYVTLYMNDPIEYCKSFSTQALVGQVYEHLF